MAEQDQSIPKKRHRADFLGFVAFLAICFVVSALGGLITASSVASWYPTLAKPPFNPPDWLFAPVWTALYLMMAIAGWRVWRRLGWRDGRKALIVYSAQLALNLGWSAAFFGLRMPGMALLVIVLLLAAIVTTTRLFWSADRLAGALFLPYVAWVSFATALNAAIWLLN